MTDDLSLGAPVPGDTPPQKETAMSTIDAAKLTGITLGRGAHATREQGMCLMEVAAWVAGEPHSDHPTCVSPVLAEMGRGLNDVLPDALRQQLVGLIPALPGTAGDGLDETRSYLALDWLIRTWLPTWLDLSPACRDHAAKVRELGRIVDLASAKRAAPVVREARESARAAGDAAGDAAWAAAWDAAWAAARDAAWVAAEDAVWFTAGAPGEDAVWVTAGDAAEAAAEAAGGAAAWAAAWAAARDHLQPTVVQLQRSAIELYRVMIGPDAS